MPIVYAAPALPAEIPVFNQLHSIITLTSWDGSVFNLTDPSRGLALVNKDVEGLSMPDYTEWTQSSPSVPGQWFHGAVANARKVYLPIAVFADKATRVWFARELSFWKAMHPEKYCKLTFTNPVDGTSRSLWIRFKGQASPTYSTDPFARAWAVYGLDFVADQPFWVGSTVSKFWPAGGESMDFYGGPAKATPFHIGNATTLGTARISNPGTEDAWPVWTVIGDSTSAELGVDGSFVGVPFAVPEGKALVVDADPTVQTATMYDYTPAVAETGAAEVFANPVDRTEDLGAADFAQVPAGESQLLSISMVGDGGVRAEIVPKYRRAYA
ncbi:MAG: hypothetical protein HIU81_03900 [Acidobacteria bacterium]|nr:hypothetical protein [Acidobacteriota bacterium]